MGMRSASSIPRRSFPKEMSHLLKCLFSRALQVLIFITSLRPRKFLAKRTICAQRL